MSPAASGPGQAAEPAIVVSDVSKRFRLEFNPPGSLKEAVLRLGRRSRRDFWVLQGISLSIKPGSFFGLVGHNGSGKSTLLRLIAGIHRPTSGEIRTRGRLSALLELGSGFHPDLTGRENAYLNGAMLGLSRRSMAAAMDEIIEFSEIGEYIDAPVKIYSSGMYARLGFAVAVKVSPRILLVDEVMAVGDERFQQKCLQQMEKLREGGTTLLLVSHDSSLIRRMCDATGWLDHGRLRAAGEPGAVIDEYRQHEAETGETDLTSRE